MIIHCLDCANVKDPTSHLTGQKTSVSCHQVSVLQTIVIVVAEMVLFQTLVQFDVYCICFQEELVYVNMAVVTYLP